MMSFPKGAKESPAILKCCFPNGMPIMVIKSSMPKNMCTKKDHSPPKNSQMIFIGTRMHPMGQSVFLISAPKGQRHNRPSLKVCNARGIPMRVMANARLPVKYPMAASSPPKNSQMIFPNIFMISAEYNDNLEEQIYVFLEAYVFGSFSILYNLTSWCVPGICWPEKIKPKT